jgi:hypothetical protein
MKKFWLLSAALIVVSGTMFGDTLAACGNCTGTLTGNSMQVVSTYLTGGALAGATYTGSPVNITNAQTPFWNNPSSDLAGLSDGHIANVGEVLAGLATGTNLIGSNLSGTPNFATPNTGTTVNGSYLSLTASNGTGGDPINSAAATVNGSTVSEQNALEFSFTSQATAFNISLLFADSGNDCPTTTGCATGQYTSFGTYLGSTPGSLSLFAISNGISMNNTGTATTLATGDTLFSNPGTIYGFYATVCYAFNGTSCTQSVTYTTGAGNYSNNMSAGNAMLAGLAWNHFALFELASGEEVLGFDDNPWGASSSNFTEGIGDFNDVVIGLVGNAGVSTPEPGTIAIMGLGLAGLGLLGRRRYTKK